MTPSDKFEDRLCILLKYIHIGSCSVAKIQNNIVVQTGSKTHLQCERKLKIKVSNSKGNPPDFSLHVCVRTYEQARVLLTPAASCPALR